MTLVKEIIEFNLIYVELNRFAVEQFITGQTSIISFTYHPH